MRGILDFKEFPAYNFGSSEVQQNFITVRTFSTLDMEEHSQETKFDHFLSYFPEVDLPVTLSDEEHHIFGKKNDPLHPLIINRFLAPLTEGEDDQYTEYIPCFQVPETHQMQAVVFWRGSLMRYEFYLATYAEDGELIDTHKIAKFACENDKIHRQVATIEDDWKIFIAEGSTSDSKNYDPTSSESSTMELLATGEIIFIVDEKII